MGKGLPKSFKVYLSKLKKAMPAELRQHAISSNATTGWFLSACKYPRTPSFTADRCQPPDSGAGGGSAATLADVDRFLFENFHSLYTSREGDNDGDGSAAVHEDYPDGRRPPLSPSKALGLHPEVCPSPRFFVSPGTSNSLLDGAAHACAESTTSSLSSSSSSSTTAPQPRTSDARDVAAAVTGGSVAVMTFSKDPYEDFRRSMEEMAEARHVDPGEPLDWDFLEELLISYLELNDRCVHKHILGAFTDIAVTLRREKPSSNGQPQITPPPAAAVSVRRKLRPATGVERGGTVGEA